MRLLGQLGLVFLGSGLGGASRFLVYQAFRQWLPFSRFPFATWTVNCAGCASIAFITHIALETSVVSANTRLFLTVGVLGGFTTYSSFNHDMLEAARTGQYGLAALYAAATFAGCVLAGFLGLMGARTLVHG